MTVGHELTLQVAKRHLDALTEIVARAAAATLAKPFASIERRLKDDRSPITSADEASESIISEGVLRLLPGVPLVAEESAAQAAPVPLEPSFLLADPLDGTKEFLAGRDEFTVNLAIITRGVATPALSPRQRRACCGAALPETEPNVCDCCSEGALPKPVTPLSCAPERRRGASS